jgi:hypothetical protein
MKLLTVEAGTTYIYHCALKEWSLFSFNTGLQVMNLFDSPSFNAALLIRCHTGKHIIRTVAMLFYALQSNCRVLKLIYRT